MTTEPGRPAGEQRREGRFDETLRRHAARRRNRLQADFRRDRARIPTWVMVVVLGLFLAGWAYLLLTR